MRYLRLLFTVTAALFWPWFAQAQQPRQGPTYCSQQITAPPGFTTKTTVIPAPTTPNAAILICGWIITAAGNDTVTFQYGTGTNCATVTSPANWGPSVSLNASSLNTVIDSSPMWRGMATAPGTQLCMTATAATNATIYYKIDFVPAVLP